MADPMGEAEPMSKLQQLRLVDGLNCNEKADVVFAIYENQAVGLVTIFENFSTFKAKPFINLHDIIVEPPFRGKGIGKLLLQKVIEIAQERKCCKVSLEVREDNVKAQTMYIDEGFNNTSPKMFYWTKYLE